MATDSRSKSRLHFSLCLEQLEDRTLPNSLFQVLGTSLLGPAFCLMNESSVFSEALPLSQNASHDAESIAWPTTARQDCIHIDRAFVEGFQPQMPEQGAVGGAVVPTDVPLAPNKGSDDSLVLNGLVIALTISEGQNSPSNGFAHTSAAPSGNEQGGGGGAAHVGAGIGMGDVTVINSENQQSTTIPAGHSGVAVASTDSLFGTVNSLGHGGIQPLAGTFNVILTVSTSLIPVNANNDNGSAVTNGIPATRDFSTSDLPVEDPELQSGTVGLTANAPPNGSWGIEIIAGGLGDVALWKDYWKHAPLTAADLTTDPGGSTLFFIEGVHESQTNNDVLIRFTYTGGGKSASESSLLTVTPVITNFSVTPASGNNINFVNQNPTNGLLGLQAFVPPTTPGAAFDASVQRSNLSGSLNYIQNALSVQNGANGSSAGWLYTAESGFAPRNALPINETSFPYLDTTGAAPYYKLHQQFPINDVDWQEITDDDSPATNVPPGLDPAKTASIDVKYTLKLYLVWTYSSGVIYPIANLQWTVNFWADTNDPTKGVTVIRDSNGVAAGPYQHSNEVPAKLAGPLFNNNVVWRGGN